jgi:hypothetical protein
MKMLLKSTSYRGSTDIDAVIIHQRRRTIDLAANELHQPQWNKRHRCCFIPAADVKSRLRVCLSQSAYYEQ